MFAVGDVRAGSVKRVAAAVGEGAGVVAHVHEYLRSQRSDADVEEPYAPWTTAERYPAFIQPI